MATTDKKEKATPMESIWSEQLGFGEIQSKKAKKKIPKGRKKI